MQKRNYAVAALDMDGTLLNSNHEITPYTLKIIRRADEAGKVIALATGRCLSELTDPMRILGNSVRYVICENGACVYDVRRACSISRVSFTHELVDRIMAIGEKFDAVVQIFMEDQSYLRFDPAHSLVPYRLESFRPVFEAGSIFDTDLFDRYRALRPLVDKINFYFSSSDDRDAFRAALADEPVVLADSIGIALEISPEGVNKGCGLLRLCEHLNVPVSESMAVGDGGNDLDIMRTAGLSVAMGNAIDEVRALADVMTADCDHDGAALAIQTYMLA